MRSYGVNPISQDIPAPPDVCNTILLAASAGQAMDFPSSANLVRLTGLTTGNAQFNFMVNLFSTLANIPSSGSTASTAASSGVSHPVLGTAMFQIPQASTGFSVIAQTSGYVYATFWSKGI